MTVYQILRISPPPNCAGELFLELGDCERGGLNFALLLLTADISKKVEIINYQTIFDLRFSIGRSEAEGIEDFRLSNVNGKVRRLGIVDFFGIVSGDAPYVNGKVRRLGIVDFFWDC